MEKSFKRSHRCNSLPARKRQRSFYARAAVAALALFVFGSRGEAKPTNASAKAPAPSKNDEKSQGRLSGRLENHQDLILKAQNLSLQQDRLQASQVLVRGIQREGRGTPAFKELTRALNELTALFYTERAQNVFSTGESLVESKPREAIDAFQEALKLEDRNVTVLKALARMHLRLDECDRAEARVRQAEETNPYSAEIKLLRLQTLSCQNSGEAMIARFAAYESDLEPVKKFARGLRIKEYLKNGDIKKTRSELSEWESQMPDYPEVLFWKWELSKSLGSPDRVTATKYIQLCQSLSARKKKTYSLDVNLCKGRELVEAFLREGESKIPTTPPKKEGENP